MRAPVCVRIHSRGGGGGGGDVDEDDATIGVILLQQPMITPSRCATATAAVRSSLVWFIVVSGCAIAQPRGDVRKY